MHSPLLLRKGLSRGLKLVPEMLFMTAYYLAQQDGLCFQLHFLERLVGRGFFCLLVGFFFTICRTLLVNCHVLEVEIWDVGGKKKQTEKPSPFDYCTVIHPQSRAVENPWQPATLLSFSSVCPCFCIHAATHTRTYMSWFTQSRKDDVKSSYLLHCEVSWFIFEQLSVSTVISQTCFTWSGNHSHELVCVLWKGSSQMMVSDQSRSTKWVFLSLTCHFAYSTEVCLLLHFLKTLKSQYRLASMHSCYCFLNRCFASLLHQHFPQLLIFMQFQVTNRKPV